MPPPALVGGGAQQFYTTTLQGQLGRIASMPKLTKLKDLVILADTNLSPLHLKARHVKGVNVAYGNGSAKWVPRDAFMRPNPAALNKQYYQITEPPSANEIYVWANNAAYLNDRDGAGNLLKIPTGLWIDYDKY
jgi:hypothetical protein